jgi:hypothetical protein
MVGLLNRRRAVGVCEVQHADQELVNYLCDHFAVHLLRHGAEIRVNERQLWSTVSRARESRWWEYSKDVVIRTRLA